MPISTKSYDRLLDRPSSSGIQQKPLVCLERTVQAMNRANEGNGPGNRPDLFGLSRVIGRALDGDALNCDGCQDLKAKLDGLENMLETMQKQNQKLLEDKKNLLEDRQRDKVEMGRLAEKMARLRTENATENPKKRCN